MPLEAANLVARFSVPQAGGIVFGSGEHARAVGAKGDGHNRALMPLEAANLVSRFSVPQAGGIVFGSGQDPRAIGAEGDGRDSSICGDAPPLMQSSKAAGDSICSHVALWQVHGVRARPRSKGIFCCI